MVSMRHGGRAAFLTALPSRILSAAGGAVSRFPFTVLCLVVAALLSNAWIAGYGELSGSQQRHILAALSVAVLWSVGMSSTLAAAGRPRAVSHAASAATGVAAGGIAWLHEPFEDASSVLQLASLLFLFVMPFIRRSEPVGLWSFVLRSLAAFGLAFVAVLAFVSGMVLLVALTLFARHFLGAIGVSPTGARGVLETLDNALSAAWGGIFNGLSYLTTTGWNSVEWQGARNWSGLSSPGLILAGLAMMGGGVATTAGGVKLLRVYALARHSQRELEKIVHPNSVGGGGLMARRLRNEGAYLAFIFFMLFASSIAVVIMLISLQGIEFDSATILSIAALTNTGPLAGAIPMVPTFQGSAGLAGAPWEGWAGLPGLTKAILAGAMIAGRVETLAILALLSPEYWRR